MFCNKLYLINFTSDWFKSYIWIKRIQEIGCSESDLTLCRICKISVWKKILKKTYRTSQNNWYVGLEYAMKVW